MSDMLELYEQNLPVGHTGAYTLTVNEKWLGDESLLSTTVISDDKATVDTTAISGNVIRFYLTGVDVGLSVICVSYETASRSHSVEVLVDVTPSC